MSTIHRPVVRAGLAGVAGVLLGVSPAAAVAAGAQTEARTPAPQCQMVHLPVPPNVINSEVTGGDHTGRQLAGRGLVPTADGGTSQIALQWIDGHPRVLDLSALQPYVDFSVNDAGGPGLVVGSRLNDTSWFHRDAWVYQAGQARVLPALHPGDDTVAVAVNARGDILGNDSGSVDGVYRQWAVLWPADRPGTVREMRLTGESSPGVTAIDIDDDGTILANVGPRPSDEQHPYVWPARGAGYPLAAPAGTAYPGAEAIHAGRVVGTVMQPQGDWANSVVTRWNLPAGTATIVSTTEGVAVAVNRQGTIATYAALVSPRGSVRALDGYPRVLSDRHTAAGTDQEFLRGSAVVWSGC